MPQVLNPGEYSFTIYAVPTLVTGAAVLCLGAIVALRGRASGVSLSFFLVTLCVATWLLSCALVSTAASSEVALWWSRAGYLGIPFIGAAITLFARHVLHLHRPSRRLVTGIWLVMFAFSVAALSTDWLVAGVQRYPWGYFPVYGWLGYPFVILFSGILVLNLGHFLLEYRDAREGDHKRRIKWLSVAFSVAYGGAVNFAPAFGLPVYPVGYLAVFCSIFIMTYAIWAYHLVDITPAFAARQIIETMSDALLVLDRDGIIRLVNRAARDLFGYSSQELVGKPVTVAIPQLRIANDGSGSFTTSKTEGEVDPAQGAPEFSIRNSAGEERIVTLSMSTIPTHPTQAQAQAVICIVRDVTEHKQAQARLNRQLERLAALRSIDMAITSSLDLHVTLSIILEQVCTLLHVDASDVLLLDKHTSTLEYAAGRGFRNPAAARSRTGMRLGEGYAGQVALRRMTLSAPSLLDTGGLVGASSLKDEDFMAYYAVPLLAKGQVKGVLEIFHGDALDAQPEWVSFMEALAGQAAIALDNASMFDDLQKSNAELSLAYDTTLEGWSRALDLRDHETVGHTRRVTEMTMRLAEAMGVPESELVHIHRGALLHDIGKMGIPDSILLKTGPLLDREWDIMRRHPLYAYELLSPIAFLRPALDIPYCHHEKWDGTGYPQGLKGTQIPLAARIFSVVDVWDALSSDRPYRVAWPEASVCAHIEALADTHFDPDVVRVFLSLLRPGYIGHELAQPVGT
jgi:PAS domain S-box-containing protein